MKQGYDLLKCQNDCTEPINENIKNTASQLEELIGKSAVNPPASQREIYEEEQNKINDWDKKVNVQDLVVNDIRKDIGQLGREAKNIGEKQDEVTVKVDQTSKMANKTDKKLT